MSETSKPLITVVGATSKQGRSVAASLLGSGRFRVRALTRDADSAQARRLAVLGAEIAEVPLALGHQREFVDAFGSAEGAFLMTPPIAPPSTEEVPLGRQLADAAVEAGVKHVVFSALENVDERSSGAEYAPHFTDKALVAEHIRTLPIAHTFVMLSFFYTNALEYYTPRFDGDTVLMPFYLPEDFRAPFVDPLTATGPAVLEVFSNPDTYRGACLPVVGEVTSPGEMVETFSRVTGLKAEYRNAYSREGLLTYFPELGENPLVVDEILGMAHYAVDLGYFRQDRDTMWSRHTDPNTLNWEQFLRTTDWRGQPVTFGH
ncbi:NmrA/HSCARG family protein [Rathayibacter iranicus]|uniref:NmrA/HSCARG family protein n=2 Tax=Rathayibacter iranicus TaxID=59737 RepID=A0AAD1AC60_9MICO|nr:NmrA/HSCARG family protein [Rathayibacter iranicus]AZZ55429.1 NmrA/HSCARG family protein [Rathayibacter iranicus]MWV30830.1 NAD(P)H-binding protein [Rathayibacter iranicus NCPPB 2253 = VKM Ac-1602]PPI48217.1 NmrA family protein [Rathayibacter iranicus]PPI61433.1 NmrA family protein [Rathayibacter iranicus]PPI72623.1 NmrA family protein [Rathayibacter iranicus]